MNCPVCNHSLEAVKYEYLPYHYCRQCQGLWVDAKLLKNLAVRMAVNLDIKPKATIHFKPRPVDPVARENHIRPCPHCSRAMRIINFGYDSNVFIDRCEACEGIWLDGGEILQLASHLQIDENALAIGKGLLDIKNTPDKVEQQLHALACLLTLFS